MSNGHSSPINLRTKMRARGFSILELMTVTVITGLLASMALPVYTRYTLSVKRTERTVLMQRLAKDIQDLFGRNDALSMVLPLTPSAPITSGKKVFVPSGDWTKLALTLDGSLYYHYSGWGTQAANVATFSIQAIGDLDGDGIPSIYEQSWERMGDSWTMIWESPEDSTW